MPGPASQDARVPKWVGLLPSIGRKSAESSRRNAIDKQFTPDGQPGSAWWQCSRVGPGQLYSTAREDAEGPPHFSLRGFLADCTV